MATPTFFHIGIMKSGTTSIQKVLQNDNRIFLHKYTRYLNSNKFFREKPSNIYQNNNKGIIVESDENIIRVYNELIGTPESLDRIKILNPNAKIIITIREQRNFLLSAYKHHIRKTNTYLSIFDFLHSNAGVSQLKTINYHLLFNQLRSFFPAENIHFIPYELLKESPEAFFKELYSVFDLEPPAALEIPTENKGKPDHYIRFKNRLNRTYIFREGLWLNQFEINIHNLILKLYETSTTARETSNPIQWPREQFFNTLEEEFRAGNQKFMEQTGIDLRPYGYLS